MSHKQAISYEAIILNRLIKPSRPNLVPEAARALLELDVDQADRDRMHELSRKAQDETLHENLALACFYWISHS
jgi:hypothetical protein